MKTAAKLKSYQGGDRFLNKMNRKAGKYGNGDGLDYDHDEKRFMKATKNRAKK
jgi:hypothetical protein